MDNRKLTILLSFAGALAGVVAVFTYVQGRTKRKLEEEVLGLDKQIKQLQLYSHTHSSRINKL